MDTTTLTTDWKKRAILRDALKNQAIAIIGAGSMGGALATGLVKSGYSPLNIWVTAKTDHHLKPLQQQLGIHTLQDNHLAASRSNILVLAVKPQLLPEIMKELAPVVEKQNMLIISLAAGINEATLRKHLGKHSIVRAMPNTPILLCAGATALYANNLVSESQKKIAQAIFDAVGETAWIENEKQLDTVTALSGSGPAYFFMLMQALKDAAVKQGLPEEIAEKFTLQTALGSAKLAASVKEDVATLCQNVASTGGGTEQAINALNKGNFHDLIETAMQAAYERYQQLSGSKKAK